MQQLWRLNKPVIDVLGLQKMPDCILHVIFLLSRNCKGYNKNICIYGHPLEFKTYKTNSITCDVCFTKQIKSGWHCECDYDICETCHDND